LHPEGRSSGLAECILADARAAVEDWPVFVTGSGTGGSDVIYRMREGIERFLDQPGDRRAAAG